MSSVTPPSSGPESNQPSDAMPPNGAESVDAWSDAELEDESLLENEEATALIGSMLVHLIIILTLALVPLRAEVDEEAVVLVSPPEYEREKIETIDDITYSEVEQTEVGANSDAEMDMSEASAAVFSETAEIPNPETQHDLYDKVIHHNLHGPCGMANMDSPCMHNNECSKKYPKQFSESTLINEDCFPTYQRTHNLRTNKSKDFQSDNR